MNNKPLIEYINRYTILTPNEINLLLENITHRKYLKGQYIVQQGDICRFESFVIKGCLKTFFVDNDGQEHVVLFAIENWWTADLGSFLTQKPAVYNVQCIENTEVIQFSFEKMEELLDTYLKGADEVPVSVGLTLPKLKKKSKTEPKINLPKLKKVK